MGVLSKREGQWLRRLDVINSASEYGRLEVKNMTEFGECRHECQLVRKACQVALRSKEEDLVDLLGASAGLDTLKKKICKKVCSKKAPLLANERKDEEWMKGVDAGMLEMLENREKLREETGQIIDVMKREDMDTMSDGDREAQAAQDAFAEQMREARAASGRDWKGNEL